MSRPLHFGLIGRDIGYSKSQDIFEAIFEYTGQPGRFDLYSFKPSELHSQLRQLSLDGLCAFSVTIPYKHKVMSDLDEIDTLAQQLQAVNSIAVVDGRLIGYNTDCYGFSLPLSEHKKHLKSGSALILGCGGAARAVLYALHVDCNMKNFVVVGRSSEKLNSFKNSMESFLSNLTIKTQLWSQLDQGFDERFEIMINCTPLSGPNHKKTQPFKDVAGFPNCRIYYDLNYNDENLLMTLAAEKRSIVIDGSAMLVGQALRSFDIWTGTRVPFDAIFEQVFGKHHSV